jgi:hypothetical protein
MRYFVDEHYMSHYGVFECDDAAGDDWYHLMFTSNRRDPEFFFKMSTLYNLVKFPNYGLYMPGHFMAPPAVAENATMTLNTAALSLCEQLLGMYESYNIMFM